VDFLALLPVRPDEDLAGVDAEALEGVLLDAAFDVHEDRESVAGEVGDERGARRLAGAGLAEQQDPVVGGGVVQGGESQERHRVERAILGRLVLRRDGGFRLGADGGTVYARQRVLFSTGLTCLFRVSAGSRKLG
jgi:hypothetical protein